MASQGEAAAHVGITRRQFVDLLDAGHVRRMPEGKYDLTEVARQVVKHYKDRAVGDLDKEKTRLAKSQADRNEIEIAERKRRLIPIDLFEMAWQRLVTVFRTNALAVPSAKASRFVGLKTIAEAEERLREVCDSLLRGISETDPRGVVGLDRKDTGKREAA